MERNLCIFPKAQPQKREQLQRPTLPPPPPNGMFGNVGVLPEDLLVEILSMLPVRHLLRLRCVCKSWCALIDDANFIERHHRLRYSICKEDGDIPYICWGPETDFIYFNFHVHLLSKQNGDDVFKDLTADLVCDSAASFANAPGLFDKGLFVGVVNGVVCFIWGCHDLGLWNPATREFKAITPWLNHPVHRYCLNLIGFGFDCISNDFKIVRGTRSDADEPFIHEVYSLSLNSWKRVREPSCVHHGSKGAFTKAYLNGVCYWCVYTGTSIAPGILSFNFSTDDFGVYNMPHNLYDWTTVSLDDWTITEYKECLAFVVSHTDMGNTVRNFEVWVVTEFHNNSGIPVSWQHLFSIGPFPSPDVLCFHTFRTDGDVVLIIKSSSFGEESSLYNPSTGTFKNMGFIPDGFFRYVESLFPLSKRLIRS